MRSVSSISLIALAIAGSLAALPAGAQTLGNPSSGAGSTTGSFGTGTGTTSGSFSSGIGGSSLENSGAAGGLDSMPEPNIGSSGSSGIGSESAIGSNTTEQATEGSSTINSVNSGDFARSGNIGTSDVTGFGGEENSLASSGGSGQSYTPGAGNAAQYRISSPPVGIDLSAIRAGLRNAPSATPKASGD
ncbi:hypothetical protein [Fulvimarina sp. MAC3]|uniref:hypothetical protein n=1 Tax=Fulvimarina sp. MAC3 TaxID=3148887 RepID=UPI0031FBD9F4